MRNLKKVLGLVLCLAMMLSIMVVGAGAVFADQKDIDTKPGYDAQHHGGGRRRCVCRPEGH